jgi:outer membrane protein W
MRKSIVIAASLLFVVASAFAQQHATPANTVSLFVSDLSLTHSASSGSRMDVSYGGAFDHMFNRHISAELSVTSQPARRYFTTLSLNRQSAISSSVVHFHPIDANVSYHFLTDSRWKPYIGGGLRYLNNSVLVTGLFGDSHRFTTRTVDPEISGGVVFQFRPTLGLRFDAKQIVGSSGSVLGERAFTGSVGLSFRF